METASRGLQILHLDSLGIMACRGVGLDQPGGDFTYMEVASTEGLVACQEKGAITCVSQGACFQTTRWRCVGRVAIAQLVARRSHVLDFAQGRLSHIGLTHKVCSRSRIRFQQSPCWFHEVLSWAGSDTRTAEREL